MVAVDDQTQLRHVGERLGHRQRRRPTAGGAAAAARRRRCSWRSSARRGSTKALPTTTVASGPSRPRTRYRTTARRPEAAPVPVPPRPPAHRPALGWGRGRAQHTRHVLPVQQVGDTAGCDGWPVGAQELHGGVDECGCPPPVACLEAPEAPSRDLHEGRRAPPVQRPSVEDAGLLLVGREQGPPRLVGGDELARLAQALPHEVCESGAEVTSRVGVADPVHVEHHETSVAGQDHLPRPERAMGQHPAPTPGWAAARRSPPTSCSRLAGWRRRTGRAQGLVEGGELVRGVPRRGVHPVSAWKRASSRPSRRATSTRSEADTAGSRRTDDTERPATAPTTMAWASGHTPASAGTRSLPSGLFARSTRPGRSP